MKISHVHALHWVGLRVRVLGFLYKFVWGMWGGHVEIACFKGVVVTLSYVKGRGRVLVCPWC